MEKQEALETFQLNPDQPIMTIIGGSQGSVVINTVVAASLDYLMNTLNAQIIWQTGTSHFDSLQHFKSEYSSLRLFPFIDNMGTAYAAADLVVSRAGALTLSEIAYCAKPSLLVPFLGAAADHQTKNAESLEKAGAAVVIPESKLSPEKFTQEIKRLLTNDELLEKMGAAAKSVSVPDASEKIVDIILDLAKS